jgi:hypothetical protein
VPYIQRPKHILTCDKLERLMSKYDDIMLAHIPPMLQPHEKEHVLIIQDETIFHTNKYHRHVWLTGDQQPIKRKGNRRAIHVSDFICETIG